MAKLVEEAPNAPGQCLVSQDIDGPFIDAECWAPWRDPYVYLSARWVEEVARDVLDMVPRKEVEAKIASLEEQLASYGETVSKLNRIAEVSSELEQLKEEVVA